MTWPSLPPFHASRARFQWTTSHPPVPSPSSTAVVLTTTRSPTATSPINAVRTYALRPSTSTRWSPSRSERIVVTVPVRKVGTEALYLQARDQLLDAFVAGLERVLAQHGALRLVVELQ